MQEACNARNACNACNVNTDDKCPQFNIFGSSNSLDVDMVVPVPPTWMDEKKHTGLLYCNKLKEQIQQMHPTMANKDLDVNIVVVQDGVIVWCLKGSSDETNNAVFYTYKFHTQEHSCLVARPIARNVQAKIERTCRTITSFFKRSAHRAQCAKALKSQDVSTQLSFLQGLNFAKVCWQISTKDLCVQYANRKKCTYCTHCTQCNAQCTLFALMCNHIHMSVEQHHKLFGLLFDKRVLPQSFQQVYRDQIVDNPLPFDKFITIVETYDLLEDKRFYRLGNQNYHHIQVADFFNLIHPSSQGPEHNYTLIQKHIINPLLRNDFIEGLKRIAFQGAQLAALLKGKQVYSKDDAARLYPQLVPFLYRKMASDDDLHALTMFMHVLIINVWNFMT